MWIVAGIGVVALALNIPLGAWRVRVKQYSAAWFLAIHLSVPFIWGFRVLSGVSLANIPLFVVLAVAGQVLGGKLFPRRE